MAAKMSSTTQHGLGGEREEDSNSSSDAFAALEFQPDRKHVAKNGEGGGEGHSDRIDSLGRLG